jgi:hypothetical protein
LRHFALIHRIPGFACAVLASVLLHPGLAAAVALGNIALQSSLGQPLRVVIPVALSTGETLNTACLKLARDPAPGTPQLLTGRVSVERNASGTRLIVTTPRPVEEPTLRVSVQAGCSDTMRRDYVLLLDPQGFDSNTKVASADLDEFKNYVATARPDAPVRPAQRVALAIARPVVVDAAPAPTTFKPIEPPPGVFTRVQKPVPPAPVVALPAPPPEPVLLATAKPQGGFIPEAAAASLSRVSNDGANTVAAANRAGFTRNQAEAAEETLWTQTWPYGAVLLSIGAIALTAFAKRRRIVVPAWGAPTVNNLSKTPMQNTASANTFAHFGVMTEPAPIMLRAISLPARNEEPTYDASLDTLLQESVIETDGIDENVIRQTWASVANESAVDIGTDSILKAIARAERELHISPPEPAQAAIDKALDDDLMFEPKLKR